MVGDLPVQTGLFEQESTVHSILYNILCYFNSSCILNIINDL